MDELDADTQRRQQLVDKLRLKPEQRETGDDKSFFWIVGTFGVVLIAGLMFGWVKPNIPSFFSSGDDKEEETKVAVTAPTPQPAPSVSSSEEPVTGLHTTGYVTARRQASVSAQIIGTISKVLIEEGDHVEAGQLLTQLEDAAQRATVAQAKSQLEVSKADLSVKEVQTRQAVRNWQRLNDLHKERLIDAQSVEQSATDIESLTAQLHALQHKVKSDQAAVDAALVQLSYTQIRAPFAGVVIAKTAQPGEVVSPSSAGGGFTRTGIGTIVDMDSLEIEIDVAETYINRIKPNQAAVATLDAYSEMDFPAHVVAVIPAADRSKATIKVRVGIDVKDPRILPDMGVRVAFK